MNLKFAAPLLLLVLGVLLTSGCATVTRGTTEQLQIQSDPSGATVRLSNGFTGITPATFTIPRKGDLVVTLTKEGYDPVDIPVTTGLAGAGTAGFLGNVLIGGIIGGGVDIATGATLSHSPNPVTVTLKRSVNTESAPPLPTADPAPPPATPAAPAPEDKAKPAAAAPAAPIS
jgi:hypothetical protein